MKKFVLLIVIALMLALGASPRLTYAASKAEIDRDATAALQNLYENTPAAKRLAENAKGILVFPGIIKGGFIVGAHYGDGALFKNDGIVGYYSTFAASYGLQAGGQKFGYAMFFMNDEALAYLDKSQGWEVGVGPSVVVLDKETAAAFGKSLTSSTLKDDIYAFIFSQKGLMAGIGLQGSKITKINPE